MSIFIIRGPEAAGQLIRTAQPLPAPVLKALVHRAIDAGTTVAIRACGSEQELLDALRVADHSRGEVTLLDPGAHRRGARVLRAELHACAGDRVGSPGMQRGGVSRGDVNVWRGCGPEPVAALRRIGRVGSQTTADSADRHGDA